jgi:hypothetical protein
MNDLQLNECPPNSLVMRVLSVTAENDSCQDIFWRVDDQYAPISIFVNCNDVFWWGCADAEAITADNLDIFEQAYRDAPKQGGLLFCCRVRGMRPQGAYYKYLDDSEKPLFDACGPEREIGIGNPLPQNTNNEESL